MNAVLTGCCAYGERGLEAEAKMNAALTDNGTLGYGKAV